MDQTILEKTEQALRLLIDKIKLTTGKLVDLTTTSKVSLVSAINEINAKNFTPNLTGLLSYTTPQSITLLQKRELKKELGADIFINVEDFGAKHNGGFDDTPAIQAAIDYARSFTSPGDYRRVIYFPAGYYTIYSPIDCTNTNGIVLKGEGGRYINTIITANTGGIALDFTGTTLGGIQDLLITAPNGLPNPSTIGIQCALSKDTLDQSTPAPQLNGLNFTISNVCVFMGNFVNANAGLGSIGLINCRSEEFGLTDFMVRANTPVIFTTQNNLQPLTGYNYTILSSFARVQDDPNGSMGGVNFSGQCSLQGLEHLTPCMLLNGVNSFNFQGYMGRISNSLNGTYETAMRIVNQTYGIRIHATIESYSQIMNVQNTIENGEFLITTANHASPLIDVVYLQNYAELNGLDLKVGFGNANEFNNGRKFFNTPVIDNGATETNARIYNSVINCSKWVDNTLFIPGNLLKGSQDVDFKTGQSFSKKGSYIFDNKSYLQGLGVTNGASTISKDIIRFKEIPITEGGGYHHIKFNGVVQLGNYGTGGANGICAAAFEGSILVSRKSDGTYSTTQRRVVILNKTGFNTNYMDINTLDLSFDFTNLAIPKIILSVGITGTSTNEAVYYKGTAQINSNFKVSDPVILA